MIRITSKRDGFRRCGVAHTRAAKDWPDDRFSIEELEALRHEPMLTVTYIEETPPEEDKPPEKDKPEGGGEPDGDGANIAVDEQDEKAPADDEEKAPADEEKTPVRKGGRKKK